MNQEDSFIASSEPETATHGIRQPPPPPTTSGIDLSPEDNPLRERRSGKDRRQVEVETSKEQISKKSLAVSSHRALFYHLIDPDTLRRLAKRKTVGGIKYGVVQWRIGLNDVEYVTDRFNHLWEHLIAYMEDGNEYDDNLGAMLWALDCLCAAERLCPEVVKQVIGTSKLFGATALAYHQAEQERKS